MYMDDRSNSRTRATPSSTITFFPVMCPPSAEPPFHLSALLPRLCVGVGPSLVRGHKQVGVHRRAGGAVCGLQPPGLPDPPIQRHQVRFMIERSSITRFFHHNLSHNLNHTTRIQSTRSTQIHKHKTLGMVIVPRPC